MSGLAWAGVTSVVSGLVPHFLARVFEHFMPHNRAVCGSFWTTAGIALVFGSCIAYGVVSYRLRALSPLEVEVLVLLSVMLAILVLEGWLCRRAHFHGALTTRGRRLSRGERRLGVVSFAVVVFYLSQLPGVTL